MAEPMSCCAGPGGYCARVDTLFNLPGVHVLDVAWREAAGRRRAGLRLVVESHPGEAGCPDCGVVAEPRGRRVRLLHDIPAFGAPVQLEWRQRRYRCVEPACPVRGFSEDHGLVGPRAKLTGRAAWWAISCIQRDNASVASVARRLGVDWHTVWAAIKPLLAELADDPDRLDGVDTVGVDEHIWHHQPRPGKGPKEQTGIVDLTRRNGQTRARLLDLVPGRSGKVYADWLRARGEAVHRRCWHRHPGPVPRLRQRDPRRTRRRNRGPGRLSRGEAGFEGDGGGPPPRPAGTARPPRPQT